MKVVAFNGSPRKEGNTTALLRRAMAEIEAKAIIDRCGMVTTANGQLLRRKVGAAVVSVRRGGAIHAFDTINHFFLIKQMIVPGSSYWNIGIGHEPGAVEQDGEGLATMTTLGKNMAWLLKALHAAKDTP